MVGMRTSIAMTVCSIRDYRLVGKWWGTARCLGDATCGCSRSFRVDGDVFLGHFAVQDPERPELVCIRISGGNQDIVRVRLAGIGDVGPRRVGLGSGV